MERIRECCDGLHISAGRLEEEQLLKIIGLKVRDEMVKGVTGNAIDEQNKGSVTSRRRFEGQGRGVARDGS